MSAGEVLRRLVDALEAAAIPYMLAGSFASSYYAMPRTTQGIDLVIDPDRASLDRFLARLEPDRYYVDADVARTALRTRGRFNVIDMETGWKLDLVIRKARAFSVEEMRRRRRATLLGVELFLASPEDVIVAKLEWSKQGGGSERQRRDVVETLRVQGGAIDRDYVARWIAELGLEDEWALVARALAED